MDYYDGDRYHHYDNMSGTYHTSTPNTIDMTTTYVVLPDPDHWIDVAMGDGHLRFKVRDAFEVLAKMLGTKEEG